MEKNYELIKRNRKRGLKNCMIKTKKSELDWTLNYKGRTKRRKKGKDRLRKNRKRKKIMRWRGKGSRKRPANTESLRKFLKQSMYQVICNIKCQILFLLKYHKWRE